MAEPSVAPPAPEHSPEFLALVDQVAAAFGVSSADVIGNRRFKTRVAARHVVMWIIRKTWMPEPSLPEIGMMFKRDHTTVMVAVRRIDGEIANESDIGRITLRLIGRPVLRLVSNEPVEASEAAE